MDLAGLDGQVDAVVGDDAGEALGDAAHLEAGRGRPGRDRRVDRDAAGREVGARSGSAGVAASGGR